ncbi:MAG: hypothetical protein M1830_006063, partial [Pleopsidium flavum]
RRGRINGTTAFADQLALADTGTVLHRYLSSQNDKIEALIHIDRIVAPSKKI